jgi:hypothetical protein
MARVAEPPQMSMIGFEEPVQVLLDRAYYTTSTTLYKGEISLKLVMDEPYWYAKINIFGRKDSSGIYRDTWRDANGNLRNVIENPDAIKIVYEDGIPIASMISHTMLFGSNIFASVDYSEYSRIVKVIEENEYKDSTEGYYNNGIEKRHY